MEEEVNLNGMGDEKKPYTPPEEKIKKAGKWFAGKLPVFFAILIGIYFVFSGTVEVMPTNMGLKQQIAMAFLTILAGYSITNLIGEGGFKSAKESAVYTGETKRYNDAVRKGLSKREAIEQLSLERSIQNQTEARIQILENANLYYWEVFDEKGYVRKEFDIRKYRKDRNYGKMKRAFKRAVNLRIIRVNVFGKASASTYGIEKEVSEGQYRTKNYITKMVVKIALGIFSVSIMFRYLGFNKGAVIYAFMQIVLWFGMGLMDRQKHYNFVINKLLPQIAKRRIVIEEFLEMDAEQQQKYIDMAREQKEKLTRKLIPMIEN